MRVTAEQIDALLPQTQCGQCSYGGCMPYAKAIVQGEAINRCPPGGVNTLSALASLMNKLLSEPEKAVIASQAKPPLQALVRTDECIGCTKCIQACPVDAIVGAAKQLHVVLSSECTGCGLCVSPCPVDCIDMLELANPSYQPAKARQRFNAKQTRLQKLKAAVAIEQINDKALSAKRAYIQAAIERVKNKNPL